MSFLCKEKQFVFFYVLMSHMHGFRNLGIMFTVNTLFSTDQKPLCLA